VQKRFSRQRWEPTVGSRTWTGDRAEVQITSAAVDYRNSRASARPLIVAVLCHGAVIFIGIIGHFLMTYRVGARCI
jgi:hypothetical protein